MLWQETAEFWRAFQRGEPGAEVPAAPSHALLDCWRRAQALGVDPHGSPEGRDFLQTEKQISTGYATKS